MNAANTITLQILQDPVALLFSKHGRYVDGSVTVATKTVDPSSILVIDLLGYREEHRFKSHRMATFYIKGEKEPLNHVLFHREVCFSPELNYDFPKAWREVSLLPFVSLPATNPVLINPQIDNDLQEAEKRGLIERNAICVRGFLMCRNADAFARLLQPSLPTGNKNAAAQTRSGPSGVGN
jgi:hypothetical protein